MNNGGDPGRDDYGLPPVDIEVPDDARELDADVLAYRRELRSRRRRMLARRLYGPLTRDGMVLPLLAGCLALTLLAATLLTVFTVGQGSIGNSLAGPGTSRSNPPRAGSGRLRTQPPAAGKKGEPLPDALLVSSGMPEHLRDLIGPVLVLALIPPKCRCFGDLHQLTVQADRGGAVIYLVGTGGEEVDGLPRRLALGASHALDDSENTLPPDYQTSRLTAVLVSKSGSVARFVTDKNGFKIVQAVRALMSAQPTGSPSPAPSLPPTSSPVVMAPAPAG